jgi:hypothetical protein
MRQTLRLLPRQRGRTPDELPLEARAAGKALVKRDGWMLWRAAVPANGSAELVYRIGS